MVEVTQIEKKIYKIFHYLRENLPLVNACTLRHISTYIAKTNTDDFDIFLDINISQNDNDEKILYEINLSNGTKITFYNDASKQLCFNIEKSNGNVNLFTLVTTIDKDAYVHAEIDYYDCHFVIGTTSNYRNGFIETYQSGKKITKSTNIFTLENSDICLDSFDGFGYITSLLLRIELLYNNINNLKEYNLVRNK